jgi:hypothetical protein
MCIAAIESGIQSMVGESGFALKNERSSRTVAVNPEGPTMLQSTFRKVRRCSSQTKVGDIFKIELFNEILGKADRYRRVSPTEVGPVWKMRFSS